MLGGICEPPPCVQPATAYRVCTVLRPRRHVSVFFDLNSTCHARYWWSSLVGAPVELPGLHPGSSDQCGVTCDPPRSPRRGPEPARRGSFQLRNKAVGDLSRVGLSGTGSGTVRCLCQTSCQTLSELSESCQAAAVRGRAGAVRCCRVALSGALSGSDTHQPHLNGWAYSGRRKSTRPPFAHKRWPSWSSADL